MRIARRPATLNMAAQVGMRPQFDCALVWRSTLQDSRLEPTGQRGTNEPVGHLDAAPSLGSIGVGRV